MSVPPHPDGVQPLGNLYLLGSPPSISGGGGLAARRRRTGTGALPPLDNDATVLLVLSYLDAPSLAAFGTAGVACAAFSRSEELWQAICCRLRCGGDDDGGPDRKFRAFRHEPIPGYRGGSWRATHRAHALDAMTAAAEADGPGGATTAATEAQVERGKSSPPLSSLPRLQLPAVFSDALFKSHELVHGSSSFGDGPSGPAIDRVSGPISAEEFSATYESGAGRPVVLEPASGASSSSSSYRIWDEEELRRRLGRRVFHAGGINMRLADYLEYARTNRDEQPLYCFDPTFAATAPELSEAYDVPEPFRDDLFSLLEQDGDAADDNKKRGTRPDYRWLLIGGPRSGQSWHKDPNGTSAWNLTLRGRKRWLMFPPHATPPGVIPSKEGSSHDYMTPISLAEWARGYYREALRAPGFLEAETKEGEVMYVPRGWWHMVLNVGEEATVAVSHHFLSPAGLYNTLRLLRDAPHQVSGIDRGLAPRTATGGTADPARTAEEDHRRRTAAGRILLGRLERGLRERRPEALARAEEELRREREALERKRERCIAKEELFRSRKKAFGAATASSGGVAAVPAPFSFNFA